MTMTTTRDYQVIWTRDLADADTDRVMFAALPATSPEAPLLHLPCASTTAISPKWRLSGFDHMVFTSPKGVRHALSSPKLKALAMTIPAHAFGEQTAAAIRAAGMSPQVHAAKSAEALAQELARLLPRGARVAIPGPETPAFDIADFLTKVGCQAEAIVCYRTTPALTDVRGNALSAQTLDDYAKRLAGVVCFLAPSAVEGFVLGFGGRLGMLRPHLKAVAIGGTTAAAAMPHFGQVATPVTHSAHAVAEQARQLVSGLIRASSQA